MGEKRKLLQEEYADVKRKKTEEEDIVANLESTCQYIYLTLAAAEKDHVKMKRIVVNSFKQTIYKKKVILSELDTALSHLENEISSCK